MNTSEEGCDIGTIGASRFDPWRIGHKCHRHTLPEHDSGRAPVLQNYATVSGMTRTDLLQACLQAPAFCLFVCVLWETPSSQLLSMLR
jgi:hypothetical protein